MAGQSDSELARTLNEIMRHSRIRRNRLTEPTPTAAKVGSLVGIVAIGWLMEIFKKGGNYTPWLQRALVAERTVRSLIAKAQPHGVGEALSLIQSVAFIGNVNSLRGWHE